jgi:hypothetical protein
MYQAETASAMQTKEEVAMIVVNYYASLYKAQKTTELLKKIKKVHNNELLISFNWRKRNYSRNDLLKAQLQVSKYSCP